MANSDDTTYFAARDADDAAEILLAKAHQWFQTLESNGYIDKLRTMWAAYHGVFFDGDDSHQISFGGEQGELVQIGVNHIHNIGQHMLNMITSTRPAMQARSINTDYKSLVQTKLANGLLDYYMREQRLEDYMKTAVEYAIVLGAGYVKVEWNATKGNVYDYDDELKVEIKEGDIEFSNLSPFDVYFDSNTEGKNKDWVTCRTWKNRFDIAAKYPELRGEILELPTKDSMSQFTNFSMHYDETDLIPVYEFYHARTESMPDGRYLLFLDKSLVLLDSPLPYRQLPVYSINPGLYLGTPYGYTPMFDLIGLQDAVNSLYSTVLSNQTAFGVQSIVVPQGSGVNVSQLSSGLNIIEADERNGAIRPLQLTQTPAEIFNFIGQLEKVMETISGVSATTRGAPEPNLRSGNALALIQSMTLQFMSGLQQSYVGLIEDLGTGVINILKDHAKVPRVATIVGKSNRSYIKEFTGDDLGSVSRVIVDVGNPLSKTTAGRVEMASELLQMGIVKTPEQYFSILNTGQLDVMTEDTQSQLFLTKGENERMVDGKPVIAIFTDNHALHINEHASILSDPELRLDTELVSRVTGHIQEHINLLKTTDPDTLMILKQQPLQPGQVPAPGQEGGPPPEGGGVPGQPPMQGQDPAMMGGLPAGTQLEQQGAVPAGLPGVPSPPPPFDQLPSNANEAMIMQAGGQPPQGV